MRIKIKSMNIQKALQDIYDSGLTDAEIGKRIDCAQSIATRLRTGKHKTTSYERGEKIVNLHKEVVQKKAA